MNAPKQLDVFLQSLREATGGRARVISDPAGATRSMIEYADGTRSTVRVQVGDAERYLITELVIGPPVRPAKQGRRTAVACAYPSRSTRVGEIRVARTSGRIAAAAPAISTAPPATRNALWLLALVS